MHKRSHIPSHIPFTQLKDEEEKKEEDTDTNWSTVKSFRVDKETKKSAVAVDGDNRGQVDRQK